MSGDMRAPIIARVVIPLQAFNDTVVAQDKFCVTSRTHPK